MRNIYFFLIFIFLFYSCKNKDKNIYTTSPNGLVAINFNIKNSIPIFNLSANQDTVITDSELGFECSELDLENKPIKIDSISHISIDENWKLPWGEKVNVKNKFNETKVYLSIGESAKFRYSLQFRAYDDGVAFRYIFPEQNNIDSLQISKEKTTFNFKEDNLCWWIPGDWDSYEHLYTKSKISEINATSKRNHPNLISSYIPYNAVNTPVTMKTPKGYYLSFHEAALYNYPGMTLKVDTNKLSMTSELVGGRDKKIKAKVKLPFKTPWRTIQVAKKPENLITSDLILNLNEPNKLKNIDWIKPMKYVGIWWQMHVGAWSWDFGTGKHGATTENTKKYIDFASNNNIQGILVEGWNKDWKKWYSGIDREKIFSFTEPYPDYDLEEIINYAKKKGVELIVHHETASAPRAYEKQMNEAYKMMKKNDLHYIKTGYVGNIIPQGEHHHGQWMVNHYNKVIQTAAKYNIAVDIHEPIKQTGIRRTYPNLLSEEGVRGQEFNAWSEDGGNPPEHISNVVFTRMLAGPIDYTPGIFNLKMEPYKKERRINTTLAHQLALYVVIYSPIQMVPDFIESYENNSAFEFIKAVPTDWDTTLVLNGEIGDYVTIARKQKGSENWFVGTISDEHPREININFNFLKNRQNYTAIIYKDTKNSNWKSNPDDYQIDTLEINRKNNVKLYLAPGGGMAIKINEKNRN